MNAGFVLIENGAVAYATSLRNARTRIFYSAGIMCGVAICTNRRIAVAGGYLFGVDRIELRLIFFVMTLTTHGGHLE